jgi:hypothetical protein
MIGTPSKYYIKKLIKRANYIMDSDKSKIKNFDKNYEIQSVSADGNCFFRSVIRGLQKLENNNNYKWFLNFSIIRSGIDVKPLYSVLRKVCVQTFFKIMFSKVKVPEGLLNINQFENDLNIVETRQSQATLYLVECFSSDINIDLYYNYKDEMAKCLLGKYLISKGESSYDLAEITKDHGYLSNKLRNEMKHYFSKVIEDGIYVDSEFFGPIIEYLFNINLKVVYVDNYIPVWVEKNVYSDYKCYNQNNTKPDTIIIVIYSNIEHFDAVIQKKSDYIDNEFSIIRTQNLKSIKDHESKNGKILETIFSPSFEQNPRISSFDTLKFDNINNTGEAKNQNLPESVPIYCVQIAAQNFIEMGYIGRLLQLKTTIEDNTGFSYYVGKLSNFDSRPFHKDHTCLVQWNSFRIDPEHLTEKQKELIDYNHSWFEESELTMYEYGPNSRQEARKIGYKPKNANESLYFTTSIRDNILDSFSKYFILEVNKNNLNAITRPNLKQSANRLTDLYLSYV